MRTRTKTCPVCRHQPIKAPTCNFLRVSAQMFNLDKQKTDTGLETVSFNMRTKKQ